MTKDMDHLNGACVYIIDDDASLSWAVSESLKAHGCRTVVARDGAEALSAMRSTPPDAVLLEITLPGLDGLEACRQIRQNPLLARVPVVFITARSELDAKADAYASGGDDFMTKPFRLLELRLRLAALLRRFPPRRQQNVLQAGDLALDRQRCEAQVGQRKVTLTPLECDLLECLLRQADEVVPTGELQRLWTSQGGRGDPGLVRGAIRQLRAKVEADAMHPEYILTVRGFGYMVATPAVARIPTQAKRKPPRLPLLAGTS